MLLFFELPKLEIEKLEKPRIDFSVGRGNAVAKKYLLVGHHCQRISGLEVCFQFILLY